MNPDDVSPWNALSLPWPLWLQLYAVWFFYPVIRDIVMGATAELLGVPLP